MRRHQFLPDATAKRYRRQIDGLAKVLIAHRRSEHEPPPGAPAGGEADDEGTGGDGKERAPRNGHVLMCGCDPVRRIRAAQRALAVGPILCGVCTQPFAVADPEAA